MNAQSLSERQAALPVVLGGGLIGLAISRALSSAGIKHYLLGEKPNSLPRLGESLNAEGSLEIARQFPEFSRFFFAKRQQALFFGGHALSFDFLESQGARAFYPWLGLPANIPFFHVDRIGFDQALFEAATADPCCVFVQDRAEGLDYDPFADRIEAVRLAKGKALASRYVFDATNHVRFVARKIGVPYLRIGEPRRVVFAHYRLAGKATVASAEPACACGYMADVLRGVASRFCPACGTEDQRLVPPASSPASTGSNEPSPWSTATSLLRLDGEADLAEGLAWCIPLGDYVSVGVSVDPAQSPYAPGVLMDWVEAAYARRGIDVRAAFPDRGAPVSIVHEHYNHPRCYGRNWLLTGPSCCQFWFPSAAGVATGLVAARLAPGLLETPAQTSLLYQAYIDRLAASHAGLEWLVRDDPAALGLDDLRQRADAMAAGSARRLSLYLGMLPAPPVLADGGALSRMFEGDRLRLNPVRIEETPPASQATRLFAKIAPASASEQAPLLSRPATLDGPAAVLGLVEILSGKLDVSKSAGLLSPDFRLQIDGIVLSGVKPWAAWVGLLRDSRQAGLELVAAKLERQDSRWMLCGQWQAADGGGRLASPVFGIGFEMDDGRVAAIQTSRADYSFVLGDHILPQAAFAAVLGRLGEKAAA